MPCAELSTGGGIWRFAADSIGQRFAAVARYATGLRHTVALTVDAAGALWGAPHAIDHLSSWWPTAGFSREDAARVPSETLHRIGPNADYRFPYCMFDARAGRFVVAPAYTGAVINDACDEAPAPEAVFEAHSAPMALLFYEGAAFPERYRGGLFIALHGSLFRDPLSPTGYEVAFIRFENGVPSASPERFAAGRARMSGAFGAAIIRPSGLAMDSAGALYVSDDTNQRIWRITWKGL